MINNERQNERTRSDAEEDSLTELFIQWFACFTTDSQCHYFTVF